MTVLSKRIRIHDAISSEKEESGTLTLVHLTPFHHLCSNNAGHHTCHNTINGTQSSATSVDSSAGAIARSSGLLSFWPTPPEPRQAGSEGWISDKIRAEGNTAGRRRIIILLYNHERGRVPSIGRSTDGSPAEAISVSVSPFV